MDTTQPYRILYVDDEADNLLTFRSVFRRFYTVFTANGAAEGLALLQEQAIDLVISDHRMPGISGVAFLEQVKATYPHIIRMIVTGYSDVDAVVDAINKGQVYYYITKPWKMAELKVILDNALETYALKLQARQLEAERNSLALQAAQQEKLNLLSRYDALSRQLNPHFLFNCLNVLTSLIGYNNEQAQAFVSRFSRVYRGLLEQPNAPTLALAHEVAFVKDYLYLMEVRFEGSLFVQWQVESSALHLHLPPFALQLLIENALKHNILSEDEPLHITIATEANELVVYNNLQPRPNPQPSPQIGLRNLAERIALLSDRAPAFGAYGDQYIARIPLLSPES